MNRFAANHPEDWEERLEAWLDSAGDCRYEPEAERPSDKHEQDKLFNSPETIPGQLTMPDA